MKAFVTGGSGFIGQRVVSKLLERGDQVNALARSQASARKIEELGAQPIMGDLNDLEALKRGMQRVDVVFHLAAWYKLGAQDWQKAEDINVEGTRHVLETAVELGIPKIIYTSTINVYGSTNEVTTPIDETIFPPAGPLLTEYDRTKWKAQVEVARRLIVKGAPIIILMPGAVYGPGDPSLLGHLMRAYYQGLFPLFPGPDTTFTYAYVDDIAEGHLLAAEKGKPGESYFLTGPALSFRQIVPLWSLVSGKPRPLAYVPASLLHPFAPILEIAGQVLPLPEIISADAVRMMGSRYVAVSDKAQQELGWQTRPLEVGLRQTFASMAGTVKPVLSLSQNQQKALGLSVLALGAMIASWLLFRPRRNRRC